MIRTWFIVSILLGIAVGLADYFTGTSHSLLNRVVVGLFIVFLVNTLLWLPMLIFLRYKQALYMKTSVTSSIVAGVVGVLSVVWGIFEIGRQIEQEKYEEIAKNPAVVVSSLEVTSSGWVEGALLVVIFWGISGVLFESLRNKNR